MADPDGPETGTEEPAIYFASFGRYEGGRGAEYPANEVLVGREVQRATFLNHLFAAGRRGAYLITGYRGSGKTSFANHCLREYQGDVYRRYLQRNVGRSLFWDRIAQVLLAVVLVTTGLVMSEALQHLLDNKEPIILTRFLVIALAIILSAPLINVYQTLRGVLKSNTVSLNTETSASPDEEQKTPSRRQRLLEKYYRPPSLFRKLLSVLFVVAIPWWGWWIATTDPVLVLAQFFSAFTFFIAVTHWVHVSNQPCPPIPSEWPREDPTYSLETPLRYAELPSICSLLALLPLVTLPLWPAAPTESSSFKFLSAYWSLSAVFVAAACLARGYDQLRATLSFTQPLESVRSSSFWYLVAALVLLLGATFARAWEGLPLLWEAMESRYLSLVCLTYLSLLVVFILACRLRSRPSTCGSGPQCTYSFRRFHPRPRLLLILRSIALTIFGIQLLYPILLLSLGKIPWNLAEMNTRSTLFSNVNGDLLWIASAVLLLLLFNAVEYDWIIRPYMSMRRDYSLNKRMEQEKANVPFKREQLLTASEVREKAHFMARQTIFSKIASAWLPILRVPVNLGFDILDQRLVIEAMLVGLRDAYRRYFLHWSSAFVAIVRGFGFLLLFFIAVAAGDHLFGLLGGGSDKVRQRASLQERRQYCRDYVDSFNTTSIPTGLWLACAVGGEPLVQGLHWCPSASDWSPYDGADNLLSRLFALSKAGRAHILDLRIYHLVSFLVLLFAANRIGRWIGVPPYRRIEARMTEVLAGLSSRLHEEARPPTSPLANWLGSLWGKEIIQKKEGGPFDPRAVELNFLNILDDIQDPSVQIPFGSNRRISPPIPEIIFVFDELDKVGAGTTQNTETSGPEAVTTEPLDQERERSKSLHRLFADLKNTISSGQARFVFIGGRNLHDEWLADQTARRPLLTNIFDLEIYVPSLLTDGDEPCVRRLPALDAYLSRQLFRARCLYRSALMKRGRPWLTLWVEDQRESSFVQLPCHPMMKPHRARSLGDRRLWQGQWPTLEIRSSREWWSEAGEREHCGHDDELAVFRREFLQFLAYRSKGNVKRLRELLESFIEPTGKIGIPTHYRLCHLEAHHVLVFRPRDRFRIQLIADIYRQLAPILGVRLQLHDDKMPQAVLYLSDFLLKFHRRAFSSANIERVDELVHIHRAPDLRQTMRQIILKWTDRFLHKIRNGMYDYRCTSELARELEYISRSSDQELAAFNFTLDESQFLKAIYRSRITILGDEMGGDFIAGLAELHKFDEEYELARSYYRQAIKYLDRRFTRDIRSRAGVNPIHQVLIGSPVGPAEARVRLSWGVARLRLMLQVGVSFERSKDYEHALVEYREARTLSTALIDALLGWIEKLRDDDGHPTPQRGIVETDLTFEQYTNENRQVTLDYLASLKHLNILFQAMFAEAWLAEKFVFGIDTGPAIVERELWRLRELMPFVNSSQFSFVPAPDAALGIRHSNLAMAMAELHNKAGDLLFYKGRQLVKFIRIREWAYPIREQWDSTCLEKVEEDDYSPPEYPGKCEGYLMRSVYHYNLALHDIRRYNSYRKIYSGSKYGPTDNPERQTIEPEGWSDYVLLTTAGSLADLADAYFGAFSFTGLTVSLQQQENIIPTPFRDLPAYSELGTGGVADAYELLVRWMEESVITEKDEFITSTGNTWNDCMETLTPSIRFADGSLAHWLAVPTAEWQAREGQLIEQVKRSKDYERVVASVLMAMVAGRMLDRGGYTEAAGQQFLRVAEAIASLLWWRVTLRQCTSHLEEYLDGSREPDGVQIAKLETFVPQLIDMRILSPGSFKRTRYFYGDLFTVGVFALETAAKSFRRARQAAQSIEGGKSQIGFRIPAAALTVACSLGLADSLQEDFDSCLDDSWNMRMRDAKLSLGRLTSEWTGQEDSIEPESAEWYRLRLEATLAARKYPMLNQLNGLKVLVDHAVLSSDLHEKHTAKTLRYLARLMEYKEQYDSILHFTPQKMGHTLAIASLLRRDWEATAESIEWNCQILGGQALQQLYLSEEMFTMRQGYYEAITNLYYLYDDFNDRTVHFNHATQMAATETTAFLIRTLGAFVEVASERKD